jgi:tetratricopeptide (TPR) repeat protein
MTDSDNFLVNNREPIVFAVITALVLVIYWQTTGFDFINLDDNLYVYDNPAVLSGLNWDSIRWAFSAFHSANWHPITWLSHMLDVQLLGVNPGGYHATNILLHLINSCLTFVVFKRMTGCFVKSAIVAALFAVHPAHVESVAWIAERKDVLSTLFFLLTTWAYLVYASDAAKGGGAVGSNSSVLNRLLSVRYLTVIVLFALGLMSKPMLVTLPFVLLLLDYWPLKRINAAKDLPRVIVEKIPLLLLSAASSYVTILAQRRVEAVESLDVLPISLRLANALVAYAKYVGMMFYPTRLAVWYPYDREFPIWHIVVSATVIVGVTGICLWQARSRRYLLVGWLWFLGTLVPVIGILQVGGQSMADRYTYIPFFGLFIMVVWGVSDAIEKLGLDGKVLAIGFALVVVTLAVVGFNQVRLWRDSETLYTHTLAVTTNNFLISHNLCHYLTSHDRLDEAEPLCRAAIAINPRYSNGYNTLGIIQFKPNQPAEAEKTFLQTLVINPDDPLTLANLSVTQSILGKPEEAELNLQKAAILGADSVDPKLWISALNDIAYAYNSKGNYDKAADMLYRLLVLIPNDLPARGNLAVTLSKAKRFDEAQKLIDSLVRDAPNDANVYNAFGLVLMEEGKNGEAAAQFEKALQLQPDHKDAQQNLLKAKS